MSVSVKWYDDFFCTLKRSLELISLLFNPLLIKSLSAPQSKNIFHQPDQAVDIVDNPYPNVEGVLEFDTKNPNWKLLCRTDNGGSYEAILQPDGTYLKNGLKQGTYNYGHPDGLWGSIKHTFFDVIPHFINANYKN